MEYFYSEVLEQGKDAYSNNLYSIFPGQQSKKKK